MAAAHQDPLVSQETKVRRETPALLRFLCRAPQDVQELLGVLAHRGPLDPPVIAERSTTAFPGSLGFLESRVKEGTLESRARKVKKERRV